MTLNELYSVHSKPKSKSNNLFKLYVVIAAVSIISFSLARFTNGGNINLITNVAKFNISLNDMDLSDQSSNLNNIIDIVIDENDVGDGRVRCGQKGHFDIKIDPSNTETDLHYKLSIIDSYLPDGFYISEYSVNDFAHKLNLVNNTVEGDILLGNKEKLDENDIRIYRFYFEWKRDFCLDISNYRIMLNSLIEQKIG